MKVKISKTGEIKAVNHSKILVHFSDGTTKAYKSISELSNDLSDYEEPKDVWWIDNEGYVNPGFDGDNFEKNKEIGNYFENQEEAIKAVKKLKALKRLKDKGFRFVGWRGDMGKHHLDGVAWYEMRLCGGYNIETADDLETIFGPEEKE